ncbi:MAG: hypothetical protein ACRDFC_04260 [Ignavibacteria bacterium]
MKITDYLSLLISLIFMVMGILIFSNVLLKDGYFYQHGYLRIMFGLVFVLYGLFRSLRVFMNLRKKNGEDRRVW